MSYENKSELTEALNQSVKPTSLAEMLRKYRNGERGLPTYEELQGIVQPAQAVPVAAQPQDFWRRKAIALTDEQLRRIWLDLTDTHVISEAAFRAIANALLSQAAPAQQVQQQELLEAAKCAEKVISLLWVSHHANRCDDALEKLRTAIANAVQSQEVGQTQELSPGLEAFRILGDDLNEWKRRAIDAEAKLAAQAAPLVSADAKDAERWRAFLSSARISILGYAGFNEDHPRQDHYRHVGMEIWTRYGAPGEYDFNGTNAIARAILTKYADSAIAAQSKGDAA